MPMILSALVDWIKFWSWAGLPGVLIDWQLITRVLSGRSVRPGVTLLGEEVATGLVKLRSDVSVLQVSFKYEKEFVVSKSNLDHWLKASDTDFKVLKAIAWKVLNQMKNVWCSRLSQKLKVKLFLATVESVLVYGGEAWTMKKNLTKAIDGVYTRESYIR